MWVGAGALIASAGCVELDVTNPNEPDIDKALATPTDVQNLLASSIRSWYIASTAEEPWIMFSVTAEVKAANFGNFGMRFNNLRPRSPYENNSAGGDALVAERPWSLFYGAIGAANNSLRVLDETGMDLPGGTEKYRHLGLLTQAATLMQLGLMFERAFITDETYNPSDGLVQLSPWQDVVAAASGKLEALAAATAGANHNYSAADFPVQGGFNSARMHRLANTMNAALLRYQARRPTDPVDWNAVLTYAQKGMGQGDGSLGAPFDLNVVGDGSTWVSNIAAYGNLESWTRVHMRVANMLDPSQPDDFTLANIMPGDDNTVVGITALSSADHRARGSALAFTEANCGVLPLSSASPCGDFQFHTAAIGDRARGIWMMSAYSHRRHRHHSWFASWQFPTARSGPVPWMLAAESDLLHAEALIETGGDLTLAAELINNTRVGRGQLTPATAGDGPALLLQYIDYERTIELIDTNGWELYRKRILDNARSYNNMTPLREGTVRQLPIPAAELEVLDMPIYTCGGAAVDPTGMCLVPGASVVNASPRSAVSGTSVRRVPAIGSSMPRRN